MKKETMLPIDLLKRFIVNNNLKFEDSGSGLNSECCTISGYALHIGITNVDEIAQCIDETCPDHWTFNDELERVFNFAEKNNYDLWWKFEDAKKQYKF